MPNYHPSNLAALRELNLRHGHAQRGAVTPEYRAWKYMCDRCLNDRNAHYKDYGARGIAVCQSWLKFENFLADMGERPAGMWLDRIDNNGNYEPGNCRWTTPAQSGQNRRTVKITAAQVHEIRMLHARGYTQTEIANEFQVSRQHISRIINRKQWR
jgi:hypothetical protein